MNPASIIAQMRRKVKVDTSQYTDAEALIDLNTEKDSFWSAILTSVPLELYNWGSFVLDDSVSWQSGYALPAIASDTAWIKKITGLAINYDWEYYNDTTKYIYTKAREVNPNWLEFDWEYYVQNHSKNDPIYYIGANAVYIAPAPEVWRENGIKANWVKKIPDYTLASTEAEMMIPIDQQQALTYALIVHWHYNKGSDDSTINNAEIRWEKKRKEAINQLETRDIGTTTFLYPWQKDNSVIL